MALTQKNRLEKSLSVRFFRVKSASAAIEKSRAGSHFSRVVNWGTQLIRSNKNSSQPVFPHEAGFLFVRSERILPRLAIGAHSCAGQMARQGTCGAAWRIIGRIWMIVGVLVVDNPLRRDCVTLWRYCSPWINAPDPAKWSKTTHPPVTTTS